MMATSTHWAGPQRQPALPPRLQIHDGSDPRRAAVEAFIQHVYRRRYDAQVTHFAPTLVALWDGDSITAAAGYRAASTAPLFLERYLSSPIEALLAAHATDTPLRGQIVEVGHLAAVRAGEGRRLVLMLASHLGERGCEWVVGTLTGELRQLFLRIGIVPLTLGVADPAALGEDARNWGSYYDHSPVVLAGQLAKAMRHVARYAAATGVDT